MGTWVTLHYGGPIETGLKKSLCGMDMGEPEEWSIRRVSCTYRSYELLEFDRHMASHLPEGSKPCGACRTALQFWEDRRIQVAKDNCRSAIAIARKRIPGLLEAGKWLKVARLAYMAADARRRLKAMERTTDAEGG